MVARAVGFMLTAVYLTILGCPLCQKDCLAVYTWDYWNASSGQLPDNYCWKRSANSFMMAFRYSLLYAYQGYIPQLVSRVCRGENRFRSVPGLGGLKAWTDKTNADYCLLFAKFSDCIAILSIDFSFGTSLYMNLVSFWNFFVRLHE
ncbi:hypothetical protein AURANDRAFT_67931 [Aureococcus anophagefferens]|uniref:Innexin n=1 Tax=Aureococcus anophagefferens TaxID=44056 RepID=F0YMX3_AURAN|nr:hypothetical protein AURANDRAFT_67931 [Aureococcus anophagefferens]EGB03548.1 hypothetical protein AURANDRAFT_67931 [Aureococcus anophagefferens]|eukprot:XP_009041763.1 hypothetical protein AURANDRAFT_67931 [Aureococcus anophagefferens]